MKLSVALLALVQTKETSRGIFDWVGDVVDAVGGGIEDAANTVGGGIADAANAVNDAVLKPVGDGIEDAANTINDAVLNPVGEGIVDAANVVNDVILKPAAELGIDVAEGLVDGDGLKPVDEGILKPILFLGAAEHPEEEEIAVHVNDAASTVAGGIGDAVNAVDNAIAKPVG